MSTRNKATKFKSSVASKDQKRKADTDCNEDKKVHKTSSKHFSRKKTTTSLKSGSLDKSNAVSIVAQEMEGGIFTAYFQFKAHGYYVRPIDEAWRQTVERVQGEAQPLYKTSSNTLCAEFGVDCWCNRRATPSNNRTLPSDETRGPYPWRTFVWIRPLEGLEKNMSLFDWALRFKKRIEAFAIWTSKNPDQYGSWKFHPKFVLDVKEEKSFIGNEVVDEAVVIIMEAMYNGINAVDLMEEDEIVRTIFGESKQDELIQRITKTKRSIE